jgi:GDP/UDP-N,N'-diacetylbacillosamine 2-epimerase (hydrolysing)
MILVSLYIESHLSTASILILINIVNNMRRVFFLTAARSEYDILFPVLSSANRIGLQAEVIAAGAHLSPFHGHGVDQIRADGFPIAGELLSLLSSETWEGRSLSFAYLCEGLTRLLGHNKPDLLCVAGDREEALAGAIVANFLGIHVAHLFGGDRCVASDVDEVIRPAISKLAHFHFTATEGHRERLIRMGELPEQIWATGGTGLDRLRTSPDVANEELNRVFGIDVGQPFFMLIQHPSSLQNSESRKREMAGILKGMLSLGHPVFCSYPNFDPGNIAIRDAIDEAKLKYSNLIVYHNLPRDHFVALYRRCAAIVGNSSSIVIESGFLKVPGILVGSRQNLREIGPNVLRIETGEDEIRSACLRVLNDKELLLQVKNCPSLYGDGHAATRIAEIMVEASLNQALLHKTITY